MASNSLQSPTSLSSPLSVFQTMRQMCVSIDMCAKVQLILNMFLCLQFCLSNRFLEITNTRIFTYPKLSHEDVSNASQNCHTVKNIPGIFKIILVFGKRAETEAKKERDAGRI